VSPTSRLRSSLAASHRCRSGVPRPGGAEQGILHGAGHAQVKRAAVILADLQGVRAYSVFLVHTAVPHGENLARQWVVLVSRSERDERRRLPVLNGGQQAGLAVPVPVLVLQGERGCQAGRARGVGDLLDARLGEAEPLRDGAVPGRGVAEGVDRVPFDLGDHAPCHQQRRIEVLGFGEAT
jgi:hypothetical protein